MGTYDGSTPIGGDGNPLAAGAVGFILGALLKGGAGSLFNGGCNADNVQYEALQSQINNLSGQLASGDIQDAISKVSSEIAGVATAQAAANFTTLSSINGLGRDVVTNIHQSELTQLNSFNQINTAMLQGFNTSAMQTQNATNQIIAQGNSLSHQLAQCCCEMKGVITSDGNATRALINDLNVQNLRDQLSAANTKVSNNEQNQYLLSTILAHLHPYPHGNGNGNGNS